MNISLLLRISIRCIQKHKGRSLLTILGIIVGIAAIIATLAIGAGAEEKVRQGIMNMGRNFIFLQPGQFAQEGKTKLTQRKKPNPLKDIDVEIISEQLPGIKEISPIMFGQDIIKFEGNNVFVEIRAGNEKYLQIMERKIKKGTYFTKEHIQKNSKVIVLGEKAATDLFGYKNPLGKTVKLKNTMYTVIGVADHIESYFGVRDPNLEAYLPITTARKQFYFTPTTDVHAIFISAKNKNDMPGMVKKLKKIFRFRHRLEKGAPDDFTIFDQASMIKAAKQSTGVLNLLLLIIASISLLVGGIGVMNIMLVSVSERTQEIGIRMALGATTHIILKQFILESISLCFIGGIIGIFLGILAPYIVSIFTGWIVIIKTFSVILAFVVTFIIGLIFGFYPALKASKMNPVEALQGS